MQEKNVGDFEFHANEYLDLELSEFFNNKDYGDQYEITKIGCFALAKLSNTCSQKYNGSHVLWNYWRNNFPVVEIKTSFGHQSIYKNIADFSDKSFISENISFASFSFGDRAVFSGAVFGREANFTSANFGHHAHFIGSRFHDLALFINAEFKTWANFSGAQFRGRARFEFSEFEDSADFRGAQFGDWALFDNAKFKASVDFSGLSWSRLRWLCGSEYESYKEWAEDWDIFPDSFHAISFTACVFDGVTTFENRVFKSKTNFKNAKFQWCPSFHGSVLFEGMNFDGASFPKAKGLRSEVRAYRFLKQSFSKLQATREEQRFFRLEMNEEAMVVKKNTDQDRDFKFMPYLYYWTYKTFSDYGFSVLRPTLFLLLLPCLFIVLLFAIFANLQMARGYGEVNWILTKDLFSYILNGLLPFLGDAKTTFNMLNNNLSAQFIFWIGALASLQKMLAFLGYFLIGLALRNQFRMK